MLEERLTCQVCGGRFKYKQRGVVHHGYKRPGDGHQTSSCDGALYVPYEISCERLREVLEWYKNSLKKQEEGFADFQINPPEMLLVFEYDWRRGNSQPREYPKPVDFQKDSYKKYTPNTYECAYCDREYKWGQNIKYAKIEIESMERRLNEWVAPTVAFVEAWEAIAAKK